MHSNSFYNLNDRQTSILVFSTLICLAITGKLVAQYCTPSEYQENVKISYKLILTFFCLLYLAYNKSTLEIHLFRSMKWALILSGIAIIFAHQIVQLGLSTKGIIYSYDKMVRYSSNNIATGIFEELTFRLLLFFTILKYHPHGSNLKIACYTSFVFGLVHFTSFFNDTIPLSVIIQMIFAFGIGLLLQAILIRSGNIILVIFLHACINHAGAYASYFSKFPHDTSSSYTFTHFVSNVILFSLIIILVILPISLILLKENRLYTPVSPSL